MFRKISLYICGSLLRFTLFFGITIVCFSFIFANPKNVKTTISQSGAYSEFVDGVINDSVANQKDTTLPLDDPEIQKIIKTSFPPELLQQNTEQLVDGIFGWLEGTTNTPEFSIDFAEPRKQLADGIAAHTFNQLKTKPTCFAVPETLDPFTAGCIPPYTNIVLEQQYLSESIAGPNGLLPDASFSTKDLPKDSEGKYIYERYSFAPDAYKWVRFSPWIVGALLFTMSTLIVALSSSRRRGFQRLSVALISGSVALVITPILFSYVIPKLSSSVSFNSAGASQAQAVLNEIINTLTNDFYGLLINISLQVIVLGVAIMIIEKLTRPRTKYSQLANKSGLVSGYTKKKSSSTKIYKPETLPVQSSEESTRRKPKRVKNRKYRKIPRKEI